MKYSTFNYVRTCRQRHALTEDDLAFLMGQRCGTVVSKLENGARVPPLAGALALQVIFGLPPKSIFPEFYEHVEDQVMARARDLYEQLEDQTDPRSVAKRELLEAMARRREDNADAA